MALINCPECGNQVSDKTQICVHCGFPLDEVSEKKNKIKIPMVNKKFFSKKGTIAIICVLVVIFAVFLKGNILSDDEKLAVLYVDDFRDRLKNPDSMILYENIAMIDVETYGEKHTVCVFIAGGTNSYGGIVQNYPCYIDGMYMGSCEDFPPTYSDYDKYTIDESKLLDTASAAAMLLMEYGKNCVGMTGTDEYGRYYCEGVEVISVDLVNGSKVANKVGVQHSSY